MLSEFLITAAAVGLAEFGDKTQIAILLMAAKTKGHIQLLLGVMLAFFFVDGLAVIAGAYASEHLPMTLIRTASGLVFIAYGLIMLREKEKDAKAADIRNPMLSGFTMIFLMEMGDKTQIAAGLLATRYDPAAVLAGALTALLILSTTAIYFGGKAAAKIDRRLLTKIAAAAFILIGASFLA